MNIKSVSEKGPKQGIAYTIGMARLALLADPTFRESWEIHRWGFLGEPLLSSVVFPVGLVLESLLKHGHRDPETVERLFQKWEANDYCYFDESCSLPPDIDLTGLMFRLHRYRLKTDDPAQSYLIPLKRIEVNRLPSDEVPVWLMNPAENDGRDYARLSGNHCMPCLANLLMGLWELGVAVNQELVKAATIFLLKRIMEKADLPIAYYSPLTAHWRLTELTHRVATQDAGSLGRMAVQAQGVMQERFGRLLSQIKTSQQMAIGVLISLRHGVVDPFVEERIQEIINNQRHDGFWEAEPFYIVPSIGGTTEWHSSRLMTTAVCYDALMSYLTWKYR